MVFVRSLLMYL